VLTSIVWTNNPNIKLSFPPTNWISEGSPVFLTYNFEAIVFFSNVFLIILKNPMAMEIIANSDMNPPVNVLY